MKLKPEKHLTFFLKKRNANTVSNAISGQDLLNRIIEEKQKEFVGEGINFFDLKRLGNKIKRYAIDNYHTVINYIAADDFRFLFPIPDNELKYNIKVEQNPQWSTTIK